MASKSRPSFKDLPLDKNGPTGNAWGLWGPDDQLGTLNLLTDEIVGRAAKEEIRTGARISLNWSLTGPSNPRFPRKILEIKTTNKAPLKHAHDDEWTFNSQASSQWDGFRHYAYQKEALYFMGRTAEEFAASPEPNGIQHVSKKGIAGRAILVDWYSWAQKKGKSVDATSDQAVPFSDIVEVLNHQGMSLSSFRPGDIVFFRLGYIDQYENMSDEKRNTLNERYKTQKPENIGIQASREFLEFLWENQIAAVAGDSRAFEAWPCKELEWHLHEWLLAGWGMPIGELFDLEELSRQCTAQNRYTFFLSSSPMNAPGAVASPPNALAFF
ncbi:hypothetical protein BU24DRAFT_482591 [Aaosphaeria arxii CBS 175.79]|uniref:Cyclase n=1 Tax=Aaosphaeria arxii CBS 175.79 TaxID=1450172 RepID=A0A6A5XQB6_9PLEO|nr:uncharacterized protein BU24DRAFT_482591 [Aaosphaeria arxii CBS 175.79]KAF2015079.1 hypothetical protein BU24DRAFT_482591 [Aaosphaeria arxii CBS 175.79]